MIGLPRYNEKRGRWEGGDTRTLYAFTDKRTGRVSVHPGINGLRHSRIPCGPECDVRIATRGEAEAHWQKPLHPGWKVKS